MKKQSYSLKQMRKDITNGLPKKNKKKNQSVINSHLKKHLKCIIDNELKKESRGDALKILSKATRGEVAEFLFTHYSDGLEIGLIGSCLDFIKNRLVKEGEVDKSFGKSFGFDIEFK